MNQSIVLQSYVALGLPEPEFEFQFHPTRKWRFDLAWPEYKLALEVEGGVWKCGRHNRPTGFINDMEKYNEAACMGWRLLRCMPQQVNTMATIEMIKRALA